VAQDLSQYVVKGSESEWQQALAVTAGKKKSLITTLSVKTGEKRPGDEEEEVEDKKNSKKKKKKENAKPDFGSKKKKKHRESR
jgi:N-acetyltransferase 10